MTKETSETNVHPADELSAVREEIKILEVRADKLRDWLIQHPEQLTGDMYVAMLTANTRETLDRKALTEAFGEAAVAPFVKSTKYTTVKLTEKWKR